ncbi:MAG: dipeptidase [Melioribacteraceae bacterium]|nr:dipeptidase [Melioribacteraceae bacterium]
MKWLLLLLLTIINPEISMEDKMLRKKAVELAKKIIIVDTHIDLHYRLISKRDDIADRSDEGNFDLARAVEGGLNAPFISIFTSARYEAEGISKSKADELIDFVEYVVKTHPDKTAIPKSVNDIYHNFAMGKISLPLGMENGSPIESDLKNIDYFYDRGIRYITLTHGSNNHIGDSSYDDEEKWGGLSPFGKEVVKRMNELGIMVDISHVSDKTFWDVLKITKVPVIASHSSCREFTPGFERNMSDGMIKALAENGGTIQITFGSSFLRKDIRDKIKARNDNITNYVREHGWMMNDDKAREYSRKYRNENPVGYADVSDVAKHIDHAVKIAGIDHVGIGSDFDGVGDSLPTGLKDVSQYPNLIYELLKLGYSEEEIEKIMSGNLLRVCREVEEYAKKFK